MGHFIGWGGEEVRLRCAPGRGIDYQHYHQHILLASDRPHRVRLCGALGKTLMELDSQGTGVEIVKGLRAKTSNDRNPNET